MNGILCLDKPPEMTSFACCAAFRRLLGTRKIGHAGTLDPMATGVLPLLVGNATRALELLPDHNKRYTAALRFGLVSDTQDIWGKTAETGKAPPSREAVEAALPAFRGEIRQVPPMMSALKKDGVRLYDLARQGIEVEREARPVTIHTLELLDYHEASGEGTLDCACSKGTYIRSLCADLGERLGCGAVMTGLRRTRAAGYGLEDCVTLDEARRLAEEGLLAGRLLPVESALMACGEVTVTGPQAARFQNGGALSLDRLPSKVNGLTRVYAPDGAFLGLGRPDGGELKIARLFG